VDPYSVALSLLFVSVMLRTVAALLSVLGVLATAGCGGDDPLGTTGKSAAGPAPALPEQATKKTPAGEVAFTKYFFETVNHAFASGRTDTLVKLSAPTCQICRSTIGDVNYAFGRGQIRGGEVRVEKIGPARTVGELRNRLVTYSEARYEEVDGKGKVLFAMPAKRDFQMVIKLTWTGTGWQVAQLNRHGKAASK
jgi:hypothetical protein